MKNVITWALLLLAVAPQAKAQSTILTYQLEITFQKTSTIVFDNPIKSVDRGSEDVLVQKVKSAENILHLKAAKKDFPETNLTVITANGKLYHFLLSYVANPNPLVIDLSLVKTAKPSVIFPEEVTIEEMKQHAESIHHRNRRLPIRWKAKNRIGMSIEGLYVKGNVLYVHVQIRNRSTLRYDIDVLEFHIRDKGRMKRTAAQQLRQETWLEWEKQESVQAGDHIHPVIALEKFTIPDAKKLVIEVFEKNGGRHLHLTLGNRALTKAKAIH